MPTGWERSIPRLLQTVRKRSYLRPLQEAERALEAMDRFLQQLWLLPTEEVATHFMDWYFQIPCYTLDYSDTKKAINNISKLFKL